MAASAAGDQSSRALAAALAAVNDLATALPAEADAANESACKAVLPLLRGAAVGDPRVALVRDGITALHSAALAGAEAPAGVQRGVHEALRGLASRGSSSEHAAPVGDAGGSGSSAVQVGMKRAHPVMKGPVSDDRPVVDDLPCQTCGNAEGADMLVCEWCCRASSHLGCARLTVVPNEVWLCSACEGQGQRVEAQVAADLDGRFVLGSFPGYPEPFWGRVNALGCFGKLEITFSAGETWHAVRVCEVKGEQLLGGEIALQLQPEGCVVPSAVLKRFQGK